MGSWWQADPADASKLPAFADRAWEALGGGPSDLVFPPEFLGTWDVTSTLTAVDTPLGDDYVPEPRVVRRARDEDLGQPFRYQVRFITNSSGDIVFDRAFNTASLLATYYGKPTTSFMQRMEWNRDDPNVLVLDMPGGLAVRTRVTRRSQDTPAADRIETSEFLEQVLDSSQEAEGASPSPRIKASQCFTKYKWRTNAPPGQPSIVATQVVSDYLTPTQGQEDRYLRAMNRPVVLFSYRILFTRSASTSQPGVV